jgi:DNA-binding transcriptional LysR family regulator
VKDINWNAVYGFWLVAERGSFAAAARTLPRGSVQALHKRVRTLESEQHLNLPLLRSRATKGVELTEAGQRLFDLASPAFRAFEGLTAEIRREDTGPLLLAGTVFGSNSYVAKIVSQFSPQFPCVSIHLTLREPLDVIRMVESGEVDFGICSPTSALTDCEAKVRIPMRSTVILPRGHRLSKGIPSWRELVKESLILPERGSLLTKIFEDLIEQQGLSSAIRVTAQMTTPELSAAAVRAGLGVALVATGPGSLPKLRGMLRVDPPPGLAKMSLSILCRKKRYLPKYMRHFLAVASRVFPPERGSSGDPRDP